MLSCGGYHLVEAVGPRVRRTARCRSVNTWRSVSTDRTGKKAVVLPLAERLPVDLELGDDDRGRRETSRSPRRRRAAPPASSPPSSRTSATSPRRAGRRSGTPRPRTGRAPGCRRGRTRGPPRRAASSSSPRDPRRPAPPPRRGCWCRRSCRGAGRRRAIDPGPLPVEDPDDPVHAGMRVALERLRPAQRRGRQLLVGAGTWRDVVLGEDGARVSARS